MYIYPNRQDKHKTLKSLLKSHQDPANCSPRHNILEKFGFTTSKAVLDI